MADAARATDGDGARHHDFPPRDRRSSPTDPGAQPEGTTAVDEFTVLREAVLGAAPARPEDGVDLEKGSTEKGARRAPPDRERGEEGTARLKSVVRVERDYTAGGATSGRVQFYDGWIEELDGRITPLQFQNTLNELNAVLASAFDPYRSIIDNVLAVLTLYLAPFVLGTHHRRQMLKFADIIDKENREVYVPAGLKLLHPRKTAFFFLEIELY